MTFLRKHIAILSVSLMPLWFEASIQSKAQESPSCATVQQALIDSGHIKPGVTRHEVEKYFMRQGGVQFPGSTHYLYRKSRYLHVDVDFTAKGGVDRLFSSDDVVTKVSQLYVDYTAKD
ncbi:MAG: hypothetical protein QOG55_1871 [Acidobacteriaceae bacterium]|jgi:hypothetical protein|nr:hypothetical protein [Acidobacteriaceae bacterium]